MARKHLLIALLAGLALGGCKKGKTNEPADDMAALRARHDSVVKAKAAADSTTAVRYKACSDSVNMAVKKTASGRRALARKADSVYTAHCGSAPAHPAPALASADTTKKPATPATTDTTKKPPATQAPAPSPAPTGAGTMTPQQRQVARADSIRKAREQARADSVRHATEVARADSVRRVQADSVRADSLRRAKETEVLRETFAYSGSARDPFISLLNLPEEGPEFVDLQLVAIYQDLRYGGNSIAVLRDKSANKRYNVRVGDRIGRMRIAQIRERDVVFTIDDLGFERQETLSLRKREDQNP